MSSKSPWSNFPTNDEIRNSEAAIGISNETKASSLHEMDQSTAVKEVQNVTNKLEETRKITAEYFSKALQTSQQLRDKCNANAFEYTSVYAVTIDGIFRYRLHSAMEIQEKKHGPVIFAKDTNGNKTPLLLSTYNIDKIEPIYFDLLFSDRDTAQAYYDACFNIPGFQNAVKTIDKFIDRIMQNDDIDKL